MQLGMIGLGRMGANLVERLIRDGHECVVFDVDLLQLRRLRAITLKASTSMAALPAKLDTPRAVWVMVPAGVTGSTVGELATSSNPETSSSTAVTATTRDDIQRAGS